MGLSDCTATNIIEGLRQNEVLLIRRRSPRVACNDAGLDQPFRNICLEEGEQNQRTLALVCLPKLQNAGSSWPLDRSIDYEN